MVDPARRAVAAVYRSPWLGLRPESLCVGPDGCLYGITWSTVFRWRPGAAPEAVHTCSAEECALFPGGSPFHRGAVIIGGRYYCSCGASVVSVKLPLLA